MLGGLLAAGASLIGGLMGRDSQKEANEINQQNALRQEALQREFAQTGIQWKVEDAKKAGIHPLYALGANTVNYAPHQIGHVAETALPNAIAQSGQDISRAVNATRTQEQRDDAYATTVKALSLQKFGLENEILGAQLAKLRAANNPPIPSIGPVPRDPKIEPAPQLYAGGNTPIGYDPQVSNAEDWTKRYGEPAEWLMAPYIAWRDFNYANRNQPSTHQMMRKRFGDPPAWLRELIGQKPTFNDRYEGRR